MRLRTVGSLLIAGSLITGCGAEKKATEAADSVRNAVDPVAQAATNSAKASSATVTMDGTIEGEGKRIPLAGNGDFDFKGRKGSFALTVSVPGQDPLEVDEVVDGQVVYVKSKAFARALPEGKDWLKIDLVKAGQKQGIDVSSLQQLGAGNDPSQFLKYLEKSGAKPRKLGRDDVDGTPATKYRATIDLARVARRSDDPAVRRSVEQLRKLTGNARIPAEVWIDDQQRVVREHIAYAITKPVRISTDLTIEFSDYGKQVSVDVPPASRTLDALKARGG